MNSSEFRAALQRRASHAGVSIPPELAGELEAYFRLLTRWNAKINLTALPLSKPTDETFDRLLIEPLAAAASIENRPARWFDLGSGGGSPAIPIQLARPTLDLTMVESKVRKAAFLRDVVRQLGLAAAVENTRFETLMENPDLPGAADLVTVRAVRADGSLLQVCRYLLRDGGVLKLFGSRAMSLDGFGSGRPGWFVRQCST